MPTKITDISGKKRNRLTAIEFSHKKNNRYYWIFKCDCSNIICVPSNAVLSGNTKSCGCLKLDGLIERSTTHGHTKGRKDSPTYTTWRAMRDRIDSSDYYKNTGICERWESFNNFFEDMGERPEGTTLDRIDGSKPYEKNNCRWATRKEQSRNRTSNKKIHHDCKYKGVNKLPSGKFRVRIGVDYKRIQLGVFETEEEAALAYNEAAKKYFGDFACLNKI